jgi:hypothetical protein
MPRLSAFTPFGQLRFSSRTPPAELMFRSMRDSSGGEQNISASFDSLVQAEIYADAIAFARAKLWAERAGSQFRPRKAIELLPKLEKEYGLVPKATARVKERQTEVTAAAKVARGARRENVETVLRELMGDDFLAYLTVSKAEAVVSTATPETVGVWVAPGTPMGVYRATGAVSLLGSPVVVPYVRVAGDTAPLLAGSRVIIDSGDYGRVESVAIEAVTPTQVTATFTKPHNPGVLFSTGRTPHVSSTKRHNIIVLTVTAMNDPEKRRRIERVLRKLLRGVSTWALAETSGTGTAGPFIIGTSRIGRTATRSLTY